MRKKENTMSVYNHKIGIGIPNSGSIKTETVLCLMRALKNAPYEYEVYFKEGSILHWNRESIILNAIKDKCTHVMFIDTDMFFDAGAIDKLLQHGRDIIGVHYNQRRLPVKTTLHIKNEEDLSTDNPIVECNSVGTGFMLIDLKVFEKLKHPWFFWEANEDGTVKSGEDYWFCEKAREAGFTVWADLSLVVSHIGDFKY